MNQAGKTVSKAPGWKPALQRLLGWSLLALMLGCASGKHKATAVKASPPGPIDQINLLAIPYALNFDQVPGPDGFALKVYPGSQNQPKPVPILNGTLEILMYDGVLKGNDPGTSQPRRTWKFSAEQLRSRATKTSIGTGYELALPWGDAKPSGDKISILVRYTGPEGHAIYSAPSVVSVPAN